MSVRFAHSIVATRPLDSEIPPTWVTGLEFH